MGIRILLAAALSATVVAAHAQSWPSRPLRLVVAFAPGGVHDTLARLLSPRLQDALGQPVVVDNRAGAGGNIAAEAVARAAPDGYTFLVGSEGMASMEALYGKLSYDLYRDLAPVGKMAEFPMALVAHPGLGADSVGQLVALAKGKPRALAYGSAGIGASGHLAGELFESQAGIEMTHVPYKGGAPALADLVAGRIQVMFVSVQLAAPQVKGGRLKALAIAGRKRAAQLPEVPSTAEQGYPEFEAALYSGMFAPAGTAQPVIARLNAELARALQHAEIQARLADIGAVPAPSSPEEFTQMLRREGERWGKLIRSRNIRAE